MNDKFNLRKFLKEEAEVIKPIPPALRDMFLEFGTSEEIKQYIDSLTRSLKIDGADGYNGWTKEDFLEDFKNYINDKGLGEGSEEQEQFEGSEEQEQFEERIPGLDYEPQVDKGETSTNYADKGIPDSDLDLEYPPSWKDIGDNEEEDENSGLRRSIYENQPKDGRDYEPFNEGSEEQEQFEGSEEQEQFEGHMDFDDQVSGEEDEELNAGGLEDEWGGDENLARMDGLANIKDFSQLQDLLRIVHTEWDEEGFSKEDTKQMLDYLIDQI